MELECYGSGVIIQVSACEPQLTVTLAEVVVILPFHVELDNGGYFIDNFTILVLPQGYMDTPNN